MELLVRNRALIITEMTFLLKDVEEILVVMHHERLARLGLNVCLQHPAALEIVSEKSAWGPVPCAIHGRFAFAGVFVDVSELALQHVDPSLFRRGENDGLEVPLVALQ